MTLTTLALAASLVSQGTSDEWPSKAQVGAPWIELFDGKTLNGWQQRNGTATYRVEDGAIVGTTSIGSPNSFLCTTRDFSDFELEFEVKVDDKLNSGVQLRSRGAAKGQWNLPEGRVYGPQVEIMAGPGQAGYIYGEGTPWGWLSKEPNSGDRKLTHHEIFKNGQWNQYRVVLKGVRIQSWVNGTKVADVSHADCFKSNPSGFIGLQVHSIPRNEGPYEVRWRNIRVREISKSGTLSIRVSGGGTGPR